MDFVEGLAEEVGAEALEFFYGVGGVEVAGGGCGSVDGVWWCWVDVGGYGLGGGLGGVDDVHGVVEVAEGGFDERLEEGVVGAAEQEGGGVGGFGEGFEEVDAEDFEGDGGVDGVVDPAFFDQRDEEGAGFFGGSEAEGGEGLGVGVGLDGGGGGQDEDVVVLGGFAALRAKCGGSSAVRVRMTIPCSVAALLSAMVAWSWAASAPGWITPMTGMGRSAWMSSRARAVAVLQAMTRRSAPWSARKRALERA